MTEMTDSDRQPTGDRQPIEQAYRRRAEASYHDTRYPQRVCDHCDQPYQGPAVYCSLRCALADA